MKRISGLISITAFLIIWMSQTGFAFDDDQYMRYRKRARTSDQIVVVNRPPNIHGLTGLMVTNSAYTQGAGHFALGASVLGEDSDTPDASLLQGIGTLTIGLSDTVELGGKAKFLVANAGSSATQEEGLGDTEVALKWRFRGQSKGETIPAMAIGIGGIIPTGDSAKGFEEVRENGLKIMLIATSETPILEDSFIGVYFEAQAVFIDQITRDDPVTQENYGIINAGLLLPLSENNHSQWILEYNAVVDKDIPTLGEGDYTAFATAFRYVTANLNITVGGQYLMKDLPGFENTVRFIGTASVNF